VPLSRRISKKDGSFGGIVTVRIEPSTFTRFYAEANLRPHDIISLVRQMVLLIHAAQELLTAMVRNISKSPLYLHLKKAPVSNYFAKDALRGIPTFFSYRHLKEYPIIATVVRRKMMYWLTTIKGPQTVTSPHLLSRCLFFYFW
jgi:hypothetical protein